MNQIKDAKINSFNAPFSNLDRLLKRKARVNLEEQNFPDRERSDEQIFHEAMKDVNPLDQNARNFPMDSYYPTLPNCCPCPDSVEVIHALHNLIEGHSSFDPAYSDEYMEWMHPELNPEIFDRLKSGLFSMQDYLDLHHMNVTQAEQAVSKFIWECYTLGLTCVLVIHGKGRNSDNRNPVLKRRLKKWLRMGRMGKIVKAYASARNCDGGMGALYVLLDPSRKYFTCSKSYC